ncbi:flavin-containing monooxygenase [Microtetraspora malaysiensis]|uniref:flavin-containing monooxygenase n=1 Tax=Microtetraspora malaysiensis TaxID=161358 RepID=UPI003D8EC270
MVRDETATAHFDAVVVGAGLAGLYMLHRLRRLGLRVRVYEAGGGVGGTWYWNRYPGARCDIESMEYSYSFSPELEQEWVWTEKYPSQPELLRYIEHVADRFDLRRDIRLGTRVAAARFDEAASRWVIRTEPGEGAAQVSGDDLGAGAEETVSAQFLIMATGCLSAVKSPEVEGLERFRGGCHHTGRWPHEGVDFTGRRVAVIGTGSSGIQCIPIIAEQAAQLTVFQRTPNFSMPAHNVPLDPETQRARKTTYPEHRRLARESGLGVSVDLPVKSALDAEPDERERRYQERWDKGTLFGILVAYTDLLIDKRANDTAAEFIRAKIREIVADPDVAAALSPTDHPVGTKRPCLDSGYYATYNRDDVTLVDLRRSPIVKITPKGIRTADAEHEFDDIVLATGFDAMTGALLSVDIRGKGGTSLREKWAEGPRTYLGIATAGFPNLFTVTGPGSPSVLSNMMVSIEQHVEWIADCVAFLRERGITSIDPTVEAEDAWVEHVKVVGDFTLYPTADSWYMGANVPGKPRATLPYCGGVGVYRQKCDEVAAKDYEGFTLSS